MASGTTPITSVPPNWNRLSDLLSVTGTPRSESQDEARKTEFQRKQDLLETGRERFRISQEAESKRRREGLIDLKFHCGQQWDQWMELKRLQQGRPCLTINRTQAFVKHIVNNARQNRAEIKYDPIGDGADDDSAQIRQGIIRHIEKISQAEIAYDTGFESMAISGLGYIRVVDGWADERSADKDLYIQWVPNPFCVYEDPGASRPDWSDGKYKFVVEDITPAEFRRRYGTKWQCVGASNMQSIGDHAPFWMPGGDIRIAEYWYIEEESDVLCGMADGTTKLLSELNVPQDGQEEDPSQQVTWTRTTKIQKVKWALITGLDVIKERDWKGRYIPIIPVIGNQIELDGERILVGMVRYARESQRMYNYMYSSFVEAIALAPKSPFIADFEQIEEFRPLWEKANTDPMAYLPYRGRAIDGQLLPQPQRQQAEPPIQAFVAGLRLADENLKATFSIYDAALGQRGPQESGLAINSRKIESDVANYDWIDNFHRALVFLGIVLDDLLPYYYNTPGRVIQITRDDQSIFKVPMNQEHQAPNGQTKKYDLSSGRYSVNISTGPALATRRQEASHALLELAKVYPQLLQVAGPQVVRELDFPGKDAIAAQMEKAMPPELRQPDPNAPQIPPEAQQQMGQMQQMIQQLSQALTAATDKSTVQERKQAWETFRSQMTNETQLAIASVKTASQEAKFLNEKIFEELERIRASLQPELTGQPLAPPSSASQASAAPQAQAPAQPQSPVGSPVGAPAPVPPAG